MRRSLRQLATDGAELGGYGSPHGHMALRALIAETLAEQQIAVTAEQVLLTQGSSQALDLAARRLVKPGDAVLVDEPGYPNLMFMLRYLGARLVGVPRTPQGYDTAALEALIAEHRPRVFFTQPRLHSPTGSIAPIAQLYRVLQLAEAHGLTLVENDLYADMDPLQRPSLASLDQLKRVVHIGSFSKTISPNIRVGFVAAAPTLLEDLTQLKMVSGLTSSDITERIAFGALTEGRWRKHLKSLRDRLADAHGRVAQRLTGLGFELFRRAQGRPVPMGAPPRPDRCRRTLAPSRRRGPDARPRSPLPRSATYHRLAALQRRLQRGRAAVAGAGRADRAARRLLSC